LRTVVWEDWSGSEHIARFCQLASEGTWPELESVSLWSDINIVSFNEELTKLVGSMKRTVTLVFQGLQESFGPNTMELLRPHFSCLKALDSRNDTGLTSHMAQDILSSCPL